MTIWILIGIFSAYVHRIRSSDIFTKDFQLFSKDICRSGCSSIVCHPNTLISIDSIHAVRFSDNSKCNQVNSPYSSLPYNCHFKYIENHIFKTCSNSVNCDFCLNKIESEYLPNTLCRSDHDFTIKYRCIPGYIKNDNVCANSYLDIDCLDRITEKLVILNATIYLEINSSSEDPRGCNIDTSQKKRDLCPPVDKTNHAIAKCSYRSKCSIGPDKFTPSNCGNMHMRLSHACVPQSVLYHYNKPAADKSPKIIILKSADNDNDSGLWFKKNKWTVLGISVSVVVIVSFIITLLICFNKRNRTQRSCNIKTPKDNLFNKLGQQKFTPPPSSIEKVTIEYENGALAPPDIYNCNSDNDESNIRSIYSSNIPNTLSYTNQFCNPPSINTCQYFSPLMSPTHMNMLEMPAIQLASSGNLTSSTINSSHGTPRGTKSSGIFSMTDLSFENTHLV